MIHPVMRNLKSRKISVPLVLMFFWCLILSACLGDNYDREETVFPDLKPIIDTLACDDRLQLSSSQFSIQNTAEAWLIIGTLCQDGVVQRTHNYLILLNPPADFEQYDEPLSLPRLGFPGISFSNDGEAPLEQALPQVGVGVYTSFVVQSYSQLGFREWILEDDTTVKLNLLGDEIGEYVAGEISGRISTYNGGTVGQTVALSGNFCVPITRICL